MKCQGINPFKWKALFKNSRSIRLACNKLVFWMIYNRQETYLQLLPDILSDDALIFVKRMYPINYTHSKLWPLQWTETTWSFRKMGNATSVTLIILWMFLQNIRFCTISSALTKKNKSSYERALKPFFLS